MLRCFRDASSRLLRADDHVDAGVGGGKGGGKGGGEGGGEGEGEGAKESFSLWLGREVFAAYVDALGEGGHHHQPHRDQHHESSQEQQQQERGQEQECARGHRHHTRNGGESKDECEDDDEEMGAGPCGASGELPQHSLLALFAPVAGIVAARMHVFFPLFFHSPRFRLLLASAC